MELHWFAMNLTHVHVICYDYHDCTWFDAIIMELHWFSMNIMHVHVICCDYHGIALIFIEFDTFG